MSHKFSFLKVANKEYQQLIANSTLTKQLHQSRLCYFGEKHHSKPILSSQLNVLNNLGSWHQQTQNKSKIAIVFEMFNMNQQRLINKYLSNNINLSTLQDEYDKSGIEGFDILNHYGKILDVAKENRNIFDAFAGFPPRTMAKLFLQNDINDVNTWNQILSLLNIDPIDKSDNDQKDDLTTNIINKKIKLIKDLILNGNFKHYQYFYYLISDEVVSENDCVRDNSTNLFEKYGKIFVAQCFKDTVMAYNIVQLLLTGNYDKIVVIAGHGHLDIGYGIPERVKMLFEFEKNNMNVSDMTNIIITSQIKEEIEKTSFINNVGDYILFVDNVDN